MHSLATRGGSEARPPPRLAAPGPVTGCPEGRLHWAILLTQQACLSVPAPSCWLMAPSLRPCLSSHSPLPPCGPAGTYSATWGCWGSRRPLGLGGVQRLGPGKALLDVRAVLCSVLPASPSGPAEHGEAQPTFSVGRVHPSQRPCPAPVDAASWLQPCPVLGVGQPWGICQSAHTQVRRWVGAWGHRCPSLVLPVSPHSRASSGLASRGPGGQRCVCRVNPTPPAFPALGLEVFQDDTGSLRCSCTVRRYQGRRPQSAA